MSSASWLGDPEPEPKAAVSGQKVKGSSKIRPPPPPPPPEAEPEANGTSVGAPPGLDLPGAESNASGYQGGRPPPPPVPGESSAPPMPPGLFASNGGSAASSSPAAGAETSKSSEPVKERQRHFEPHLDEQAIELGLRNGTLIKGKLRVPQHKPGNAYVTPAGKTRDDDIIVLGRTARNRSVHGDIVVVELAQDGEAALRAAADDDDDDEVVDDHRQRLAASRPNDSDSSGDEDILFGGGVMADDKSEAPETEGSSFLGPDSASQSNSKGRGKGKRGKGKHDRPKAIVRGIVERREGGDRVIVCTLHPNTFGRERKGTAEGNDQIVLEGDSVIKAVPTDSRMPYLLIQVNDVTKNILDIPGRLDKFKLWPVQMVKWTETSQLPLGRLKGECLGRAGDLEAEELHALIEHQLDSHDIDFEDAELSEVDDIVTHADANFEEEASRRFDLRHKRIFTIDPATARDLDDAIHVDTLPGGRRVEIGVHIADVGHFLKLGSIADTEAQRRTTSVYLVHRVLPMLPHALCNHLCSLNPDEPKVSFSAFFQLEADTGELVRDPAPWFKKTVMSSVCRLNYDEVQEMLDGEEIEPPMVYGNHTWEEIKADIHLLHRVCGLVRHGRLTGGALTITKAKMIFHTRESEDGIPTGYHLEEHAPSHWIIEELMLLANRCVAEHMANSVLSEVSVLRNHKAPDPKKAEPLERMMRQNLGLDWNGRNANSIYRCCQEIRRKYGQMLGLCIEMMTMRSGMQQAEYFVYGDGSTSPHHFALNFDYYTHFTSPIRRYPDVMVHRVLAGLLTGEDEKDLYQEGDAALGQMEICNEKRTNCRRCQEHLDRSIFCIYLRSQKSWFYTIGTVLKMKEDHRGGNSMVTVYSSQLGKEKQVLLCTAADVAKLELMVINDADELLLPINWKFRGKGGVDLMWTDPQADSEAQVPRLQKLKVLSSIPCVIIPTNTVPIDFAIFFVSPFHPKYDSVNAEVTEQERDGFDWQDEQEQDEEDEVEVVFDAANA